MACTHVCRKNYHRVEAVYDNNSTCHPHCQYPLGSLHIVFPGNIRFRSFWTENFRFRNFLEPKVFHQNIDLRKYIFDVITSSTATWHKFGGSRFFPRPMLEAVTCTTACFALSILIILQLGLKEDICSVPWILFRVAAPTPYFTYP